VNNFCIHKSFLGRLLERNIFIMIIVVGDPQIVSTCPLPDLRRPNHGRSPLRNRTLESATIPGTRHSTSLADSRTHQGLSAQLREGRQLIFDARLYTRRIYGLRCVPKQTSTMNSQSRSSETPAMPLSRGFENISYDNTTFKVLIFAPDTHDPGQLALFMGKNHRARRLFCVNEAHFECYRSAGGL
jgi:hypothetical protein